MLEPSVPFGVTGAVSHRHCRAWPVRSNHPSPGLQTNSHTRNRRRVRSGGATGSIRVSAILFDSGDVECDQATHSRGGDAAALKTELDALVTSMPNASGYADQGGQGAHDAFVADMALLVDALPAGAWISQLRASLPHAALSSDAAAASATSPRPAQCFVAPAVLRSRRSVRRSCGRR